MKIEFFAIIDKHKCYQFGKSHNMHQYHFKNVHLKRSSQLRFSEIRLPILPNLPSLPQEPRHLGYLHSKLGIVRKLQSPLYKLVNN